MARVSKRGEGVGRDEINSKIRAERRRSTKKDEKVTIGLCFF